MVHIHDLLFPLKNFLTYYFNHTWVITCSIMYMIFCFHLKIIGHITSIILSQTMIYHIHDLSFPLKNLCMHFFDHPCDGSHTWSFVPIKKFLDILLQSYLSDRMIHHIHDLSFPLKNFLTYYFNHTWVIAWSIIYTIFRFH